MTSSRQLLSARGSLSDVLERSREGGNRGYRALFCDVWGVLHDGQSYSKGAVHALLCAREQGLKIALVTNAPRPAAMIAGQLQSLGVKRDAYHEIITSGEVTQDEIAKYRGKPLFHLGPERDQHIFDETGVTLTGIDKAVAIVITGLFDDTLERPQDYRDLLLVAFERDLLMICANPDHIVIRAGVEVYCAGAVAALYEEMGGRVSYAGKPFASIYSLAQQRLVQHGLAGLRPSEILAIGDGPFTDVRGANDYGVDCLFVTGGILQKLFASPNQTEVGIDVDVDSDGNSDGDVDSDGNSDCNRASDGNSDGNRASDGEVEMTRHVQEFLTGNDLYATAWSDELRWTKHE